MSNIAKINFNDRIKIEIHIKSQKKNENYKNDC